MIDVRRVFSQIGPDQVTPGYYVLDDNTLTMVDEYGTPVLLGDAPVTAKLGPDSADADAIARLLTKRIRKAMRGDKVEGFNRALTYAHESF